MNARAWLLVLVLAWPFQPFDDAVRAAVQAHRAPWCEAPMHAATDLARPLLVAGALAALLGGPVARATLLEAGVALVPVNLVVQALKYAVNRRRPSGDRRRVNSAFPSSHAANAFALVAVLARRHRRFLWAGAPLALLVAYSRLYLDRHWFTDVLGGAVIGFALAAWAAALFSSWRERRSRPANS